MATQHTVNASAAIDNDRTTVIMGGNVGAGISNVEFGDLADDGQVGPKTSSTVQKAISAGIFADMEDDEYLIIGTIDRLAQTTVTNLKYGGFQEDHNPHAKGENRYHISGINMLATNPSGVVQYGGSQGVAFTYINIAGSAIPFEAEPTPAVPGEFVTYDGGIVPVQKDYDARGG